MNVLGRAELALFPGLEPPFDDPAEQRGIEAAPLRQRLARVDAPLPFEQLDLGRAALARGEFLQARDLLQRAIRRHPTYHEAHYFLAIALAGMGDTRGAAEQLAEAARQSTTRRDQALYAGKLERLKALEAQAH